MAIVGDVFGLNSVYAKQVENVENSNFKSWPENAEHGYWAGGQKVSNSNYESEISRLDFSTETALTYPAILPVNAEQVASVTTNSYGYFGGGAQPTVRYNVISRLDFITETSSLPGNNLPVTKHLHAGTNTDTYGYFVGGYQNNVRACVITRLDFNTESISLPGNDVPGLKSAFTAVASNSALTGCWIYITNTMASGSELIHIGHTTDADATQAGEYYAKLTADNLNTRLFSLKAGEFAFFPYDYTGDLYIDASAANQTYEFYRFVRS